MTDRLGSIGTQYSDDAGNPLIDGKLYFYDSGTLTTKNTYADINLTILNTNPVLLDGAGRQPNVWFEGFARIILTSSDEVQIEERDPIGSSEGGAFSSWASSVIYAENNFVMGSDGNFYRSLSAGNVGNDPITDITKWTRVQFTETWNAVDVYSIGDIVQGSDGFTYISLANTNSNNDPVSDIVNWIIDGGKPSYQFISEATISSDAFIDFTFPSGFKKIIVDWSDITTSTAIALAFRTSSDSGVSFDTGSLHYSHSVQSVSTAGAGGNIVAVNQAYIQLTPLFLASSGTVELFLPDESAPARVVTMSYGETVSTTEWKSATGGGVRKADAIVNAIRIYPVTSTMTTGTIRLYGVV